MLPLRLCDIHPSDLLALEGAVRMAEVPEGVSFSEYKLNLARANGLIQ